MASTSNHEKKRAALEPPGFRKRSGDRRGLGAWLLARLDSLFLESLGQASPSEVIRYRVLTGAALFLLLLSLLYLGYTLLSPRPLMGMFMLTLVLSMGFLVTLVLVRETTSPTPPALLLCTIVTAGFVCAIFQNYPTSSTHASIMLCPVLAVYLVGQRLGFLITAFTSVVLGVVYPFYYVYFGTMPLPYTHAHFWMLQVYAAFSILGVWLLSSLHSTTRDETEVALRRTLRDLRESENKLLSLIESTDDLVCSLDTEWRVLTANSALKRFFLKRFGGEPVPGQVFFTPATPEHQMVWRQRLTQVLGGQHVKFEAEYDLGDTHVTLDISLSPILDEGGRITGVTVFGRDISARKQAEARLGEMHRTLVDISRQAGMAEVATGVLHNVGNTLNSVNVSTTLVIEQLQKSRVSGFTKAARLMREHSEDLPAFLSQDTQGRKLPAYLIALADQLHEEREAMLKEMRSLGDSIEHIKSIVRMQQKHARAAGAMEQVTVPQLIDEALRLHAVSFERLGINIQRDYEEVPPVLVDRHKLLQILINLLSNARHALMEGGGQDKRLIIRVRLVSAEGRLLVEVADNGIGVAPEHLSRLFTQGFTTRKDGHGFGLHISALAATEMKGRLTCMSPGPGLGATFMLELPMGGVHDEPSPEELVVRLGTSRG